MLEPIGFNTIRVPQTNLKTPFVSQIRKKHEEEIGSPILITAAVSARRHRP